jgi:hypothetical protein
MKKLFVIVLLSVMFTSCVTEYHCPSHMDSQSWLRYSRSHGKRWREIR